MLGDLEGYVGPGMKQIKCDLRLTNVNGGKNGILLFLSETTMAD